MVINVLQQLTAPEPRVAWWQPPGRWQVSVEIDYQGILSGAFNPLHRGHQRLRDIASRKLGGEVAYELSAINADKPPLTDAEIETRCRQFASCGLAVTNAATFVEKSRLFPHATFVVGADTARRILNPRFYGDRRAAMIDGLKFITDQNCRFLVAARKCDQELITLEDLAVPDNFQTLFAAIPAQEFRIDLSSTELRQSQ